MKTKRLITLAVIALFGVGALGLIGYRVFAQANNASTADAQPCEEQDDDGNDLEEQCGDAPEDEAGEAEEAGEISERGGTGEQAPAQTGLTAAEAQAIAEGANPGATAR